MKTLARVSLSPAPLIYTSDLNSPAISAPQGADMKAFNTHMETENAENKTSQETQQDPKMEDNRNLFRRFFCCLCMPRTKDTTSR